MTSERLAMAINTLRLFTKNQKLKLKMTDKNAKFPLLLYRPDSVQRKPVNSPF